MAAKGLSYTDSPPHPCSTCIALCPMDQGREFATEPFHRESWSEEDALKVLDRVYWRTHSMENALGTGICAGDVKTQAREYGADLVGISSCEGFEKALRAADPKIW